MVPVKIADHIFCTAKFWYLVLGDNTHIYEWLNENIGEENWYYEPNDKALYFNSEEDATAFKIMFTYFCK